MLVQRRLILGLHSLHHHSWHAILHHRMTGSLHHLRIELLRHLLLLLNEAHIARLILRPLLLLRMHVRTGNMVLLHVRLGLHDMHSRLLLLIRLMHEWGITGVRDIIQYIGFQALEVVVAEETMLSSLTGTDSIELLLHRLLIRKCLKLTRIRWRRLLLLLLLYLLLLLSWCVLLLHSSLIIWWRWWKRSLFHFHIRRRIGCWIEG